MVRKLRDTVQALTKLRARFTAVVHNRAKMKFNALLSKVVALDNDFDGCKSDLERRLYSLQHCCARMVLGFVAESGTMFHAMMSDFKAISMTPVDIEEESDGSSDISMDVELPTPPARARTSASVSFNALTQVQYQWNSDVLSISVLKEDESRMVAFMPREKRCLWVLAPFTHHHTAIANITF
jgi:hypothetical protein